MNTEAIHHAEGIPEPEFRTAKTEKGIAYGWRLEHLGIIAYGNTKAECLATWRGHYSDEFGRAAP